MVSSDKFVFNLSFVQLPHADGIALPSYTTTGAAGMDLRAAIALNQPETISPGKRALIPSGLVLEIPEGFEGQIRPRSGLALKYGVTCLNSPGTIDSDFRFELKILLINLGDEDFVVLRGMRIAQIVFSPIAIASFPGQNFNPPLERKGGFGSTGIL